MPWLLILSSFLSFGLAVSMVRRIRSPGAVPFMGLLVGITFYAFGYGLELITPPGGANGFWNHVQYAGVATLPAFWLWLSLEGPRSDQIPSPLPILFLGEAGLILILNWTNSYHHLYYAHLTFELYDGLTKAVVTPGPWYWAHVVVTVVSFPVGVVLLLWGRRKTDKDQRGTSLSVVLAVLPTAVAFAAYQLKLLPGGWDLSPLGLSVTAFLFFWLLWPFRLFDLRPVTREAVFRLVPDPVVVIDPKGCLVDWNPAAVRLFPGLASARVGQLVAPLVSRWEGWAEALSPDSSGPPRQSLRTGEASPRWWSVTNAPIHGNGGRLAARVFLLHEETELVERAEVYEQLALVDPLTGCLNRRAFDVGVHEALEALGVQHEPVAVVSIDLDHFKSVNDTFGHAAGDSALKHAVGIWQGQLREGDLLGRVGGEEFAICLPSTTLAAAVSIAGRLCAKLRDQPLSLGDRTLAITASFGVSGVRDASAAAFETLLQNADAALYEAKRQGRDRVVTGTLTDGRR